MSARLAAKVDVTHAEVRDTLRRLGYRVLDLSRAGRGCPDLLVAKGDQMWLIEVKRPTGGKLTPAQQDFIQGWPVPVIILKTAEEAVAWALIRQVAA